MSITGLISLPRTLLFRREVLGESFMATIAGINVSISFPEYPVEDVKNSTSKCGVFLPLNPPSFASSWRKWGDTIQWGYPLDYPEGNSAIYHLALRIDQLKESSETTAEIVYARFEKWLDRFIQYCLICTKQSAYREVDSKGGNSSLDLFADKRYIDENAFPKLTVYLRALENYATLHQTQSAINYASCDREMHLGFQMLLSAYEAKHHRKNRQVILDACSALELCLINEITNYCISKEIPNDILLNKYRYLGERFDLVSQINPPALTGVTKKQIVPLRNDVMHNKKLKPSNEETDVLLQAVEKVLSNCYVDYY